MKRNFNLILRLYSKCFTFVSGLLPGEQPDERSLRARTRSPTSQLGSNRELKRRRMGPPRFPSRMDIEEGEDTEDYDSMLDQYRLVFVNL